MECFLFFYSIVYGDLLCEWGRKKKFMTFFFLSAWFFQQLIENSIYGLQRPLWMTKWLFDYNFYCNQNKRRVWCSLERLLQVEKLWLTFWFDWAWSKKFQLSRNQIFFHHFRIILKKLIFILRKFFHDLLPRREFYFVHNWIMHSYIKRSIKAFLLFAQLGVENSFFDPIYEALRSSISFSSKNSQF